MPILYCPRCEQFVQRDHRVLDACYLEELRVPFRLYEVQSNPLHGVEMILHDVDRVDAFSLYVFSSQNRVKFPTRISRASLGNRYFKTPQQALHIAQISLETRETRLRKEREAIERLRKEYGEK